MIDGLTHLIGRQCVTRYRGTWILTSHDARLPCDWLEPWFVPSCKRSKFLRITPLFSTSVHDDAYPARLTTTIRVRRCVTVVYCRRHHHSRRCNRISSRVPVTKIKHSRKARDFRWRRGRSDDCAAVPAQTIACRTQSPPKYPTCMRVTVWLRGTAASFGFQRSVVVCQRDPFVELSRHTEKAGAFSSVKHVWTWQRR